MNKQQKRVILYGNSLILAGVAASLSLSPCLEIITLLEPPACLADVLRDLRPAALIFDLNSAQPEFPLAILQHSSLLLIGIDADSTAALILSGRLAHSFQMSDLRSLLLQKDADYGPISLADRHENLPFLTT